MSCPLNWLFWHLSTLLHSRSFLVHGVKGVLTRWWCLFGGSCMGSCCRNYSVWMRLIKVFTQTHRNGWVLLSEGSRRQSHITSFVLKTCLFLQIVGPWDGSSLSTFFSPVVEVWPGLCREGDGVIAARRCGTGAPVQMFSSSFSPLIFIYFNKQQQKLKKQ